MRKQPKISSFSGREINVYDAEPEGEFLDSKFGMDCYYENEAEVAAGTLMKHLKEGLIDYLNSSDNYSQKEFIDTKYNDLFMHDYIGRLYGVISFPDKKYQVNDLFSSLLKLSKKEKDGGYSRNFVLNKLEEEAKFENENFKKPFFYNLKGAVNYFNCVEPDNLWLYFSKVSKLPEKYSTKIDFLQEVYEATSNKLYRLDKEVNNIFERELLPIKTDEDWFEVLCENRNNFDSEKQYSFNNVCLEKKSCELAKEIFEAMYAEEYSRNNAMIQNEYKEKQKGFSSISTNELPIISNEIRKNDNETFKKQDIKKTIINEERRRKYKEMKNRKAVENYIKNKEKDNCQ